jgi:hypothetical protein
MSQVDGNFKFVLCMAMNLPLVNFNNFKTKCCQLKIECYIHIFKKKLGWRNQEPQIGFECSPKVKFS